MPGDTPSHGLIDMAPIKQDRIRGAWTWRCSTWSRHVPPPRRSPILFNFGHTNIIVHLATLDPAQLPDEMVISAVTLADLSAGPHHAADPVERARRTNVLQHAEATFDPLPFDAEAARAFGIIYAGVLAVGRTPRRRIADLMIAATAIVNRVALYTTNPDDFTGLNHLLPIKPVQRPKPPKPCRATP